MIKTLWTIILYKPMLNILAILIAILPGNDLGLAIIILTLLVKIITYPLSRKSLESQTKINLIMPELNKIKKDITNKEKQAKQIFALYKKHDINPFSGIFLAFIQIPIIFALFYVFYKGLTFESEFLYSFIKAPENFNTIFLGFIDLKSKSALLSILVGISQFMQAISAPQQPKTQLNNKPESFQESFARSMQMQMKYIFPPMVGFLSYRISSAVALYWLVNNIFTIIYQEHEKQKKITIVVNHEKRTTA